MYLKDYKQVLKAIDSELKLKDTSYSPTNIWGCNDNARIQVSREVLDNFNKRNKVIQINGLEKYAISREAVFNNYPKKDNAIEIISFFLTVLVWGYPTGGRGKNINNIINKKRQILKQYFFIKENSTKISLAQVYQELNEGNLKITGMGPSTFTKVLYFMSFKDRKGVPALIFDKVMEDIINTRRFFEINEKLKRKGVNSLSNLSKKDYSFFCKIMSDLAEEFQISIFALEYFLFYISRTI